MEKSDLDANEIRAIESDYEEQWFINKERAELVTKWPLVAYLLCTIACLGLSAVCHLFYVRNEWICTVTTYLDYWGICMLGLGTTYPYISFKYACGPFIVWRYIFITVTTILTAVCMWATVQKSLMTPKKRTCLFILFGLSCMTPFFLLYFWYDPLYTLSPAPGAYCCLLYTSPSPRDRQKSRMPSSA